MKDRGFLIRNQEGQKEMVQYFSSNERTVNPGFYVQRKYSSGMTFSDEGKLRESIANRSTLKEWLKRMALSRKKKITEGILEHQERRTKSKKISKYNRFYPFSVHF